MFKLMAPLMLGIAVLLSSCSANGSTGPTNPTALVTGSSIMSITARLMGPAQSSTMTNTTTIVCPFATPFLVPFMVAVAPVGSTTVIVTQISTRFTSPAGIPAQQVTLPAPVPTVQFGTALDQARNQQLFPVNVCVPLTQGTVTIVVDGRTMSGQNGSGSVMVPMR